MSMVKYWINVELGGTYWASSEVKIITDADAENCYNGYPIELNSAPFGKVIIYIINIDAGAAVVLHKVGTLDQCNDYFNQVYSAHNGHGPLSVELKEQLFNPAVKVTDVTITSVLTQLVDDAAYQEVILCGVIIDDKGAVLRASPIDPPA